MRTSKKGRGMREKKKKKSIRPSPQMLKKREKRRARMRTSGKKERKKRAGSMHLKKTSKREGAGEEEDSVYDCIQKQGKKRKIFRGQKAVTGGKSSGKRFELLLRSSKER